VKAPSDAPRYAAVARALKERILEGEYDIGALLPPERELAERFAVSRQTIRAALRLLREERLVTSRQGAGTMIATPRSSEAFRLAANSIDDLVAYAAHMYLCRAYVHRSPLDRN
jgi:GntR family transcriptional regulator